MLTHVIPYLALFALVGAKLVVYQPKPLAEQFQAQNGSIPFALANFGHIPWGKKLSGTVYLPDPLDACAAIKSDASSARQSFFYIVERGSCDFTVKVRDHRGILFLPLQVYNAQQAGAAFVIIVDNRDEVTENIVMADDGYGFRVHVPAALIGKQDGDAIIRYLQDQ